MVGPDQIWCRDIWNQTGIPSDHWNFDEFLDDWNFDDFWVSLLFQAVIIEFSTHTQCKKMIITSKHPVPVIDYHRNR